MASKVFPIRAAAEERARWQAAADRAGLSFNAWARRSLNDQAELDAAVEAESAPRPVVPDFKGPDPRVKQ